MRRNTAVALVSLGLLLGTAGCDSFLTGEWVQACGAANGRFVQQAGQYVFGESSNIASNDADWILAYDGGGLVDIKQIEADAVANGDSTYLGIAKIWEALTIGTI